MKVPHGFRRIYINIMRFLRAFNRLVVRLYHYVEINELTGLLILAFIIGIIGGYAAVAFRIILNTSQELFWGTTDSLHFLSIEFSQIRWYVKILIPALGGLIVGPIIYFLVREARGSGIPEVMEAIATKGGWIRARVIPLKALLSAISIGSGGSAGREGPIVHIGSSTGSIVGQYLNLNEEKRKILIGCGASAGIAGTFNAPIGGMLFSLEVLLGEFRISRFSPLIVSSVMSTVIAQVYLGTNPAFMIPEYTLVSPWEIIPYIFLGLIGAFVGMAFSKSLYLTEDLFNKLNIPVYLKPAIGGLLMGILALQLPNLYGVGYSSIEQTLTGQMGLWMLLLLAAGKIVATNLTLGSGGSGGVFAPSLFIGATTGGTFGIIVHSLFPASTGLPGSYALVGMGAVVAGAAHAPLTAILILFEMTRDYHIILPLMLSCIISAVISMQIKPHNIYTTKLMQRGIDIRRETEAPILRSIKVREVMSTDIISLNEGASVEEINRVFSESHHTHFPVVEKGSSQVIGILNYTDYWDYMAEEHTSRILVARDLARTPAVTINENDHLLNALNKISTYKTELLPVVRKEDKNLVGVLSRNDIINEYNSRLQNDHTLIGNFND